MTVSRDEPDEVRRPEEPADAADAHRDDLAEGLRRAPTTAPTGPLVTSTGLGTDADERRGFGGAELRCPGRSAWSLASPPASSSVVSDDRAGVRTAAAAATTSARVLTGSPLTATSVAPPTRPAASAATVGERVAHERSPSPLSTHVDVLADGADQLHRVATATIGTTTSSPSRSTTMSTSPASRVADHVAEVVEACRPGCRRALRISSPSCSPAASAALPGVISPIDQRSVVGIADERELHEQQHERDQEVHRRAGDRDADALARTTSGGRSATRAPGRPPPCSTCR